MKKVFFVAVMTAFLTTFMGSALTLSIPNIENEFNVSAAQVGWIVTVYMLTCAALAVPFGIIADKRDRYKILAIGIFVFSASSFGAGFASTMWVLLLFRFGQAVGASMIFCTNIAILASAFEEGDRGRVLGYATAANYLGLSLGPVLGGIMNYNFGWRSIFIVTGVLAVFTFMLAFLQAKTGGDGENRTYAEKISIKQLFNNKKFIYANLAALLNYSSFFSISYLLSIYLQVVKGLSSQSSGIILIISPAVLSILSLIVGRLLDKFSPNILSAIGMGVCALSLFFLSKIATDSGLLMIGGILALSGLGSGLFSTPNTSAVMQSVEKSYYSLASSVLAMMRSLGHTFTMWIITGIVYIKAGDMKLSEVSAENLIEIMETGFFVFTILCIIGIFIAIRRKT